MGEKQGIYRRHQRRAAALTRAVQGEEAIEAEVALPEASRALDFLFDVKRPDGAWGVIRDDLRGRRVLLEHFSRPPGPRQTAGVLVKACWLVERYLLARARPARPPLTLVLSVGRPRAALAWFGFVARPLAGCYQLRQGGLELLMIDVSGLPRRPGTSFLRAFDHRPRVAGTNLRALYRDPTVARRTRMAIGAAVMKEPALWHPTEQRLTAEELFERGRDQGRDEGRLTQTRAILRLLLAERLQGVSRRLGQAIETCPDLARLERATAVVVRPIDAAELERTVLETLAPATGPGKPRAARRRR